MKEIQCKEGRSVCQELRERIVFRSVIVRMAEWEDFDGSEKRAEKRE